MLKYKGNLKDQWIDFKYWALTWGDILKLVASNPYKVVIALFRYPWIYDLLKANHLGKLYNEGRNGTAMLLSLKTLNAVVKSIIRLLKMFVYDTKNTIITQIMIPPQIYQAMGLKWFIPELPSTVLPMVDQHTSEKYMDLIESEGLPGDTCSYPRITAGVYAAGEMPKNLKAMIACNLPCEGGFASYAGIEEGENIPTYRLDIPNDFKSEEGMKTFVEDLKGMIAFLEEKTGNHMDWDKLQEICGRFNELMEMELERWEFARSDVPAIASENIWLPHFMYFNVEAGTTESVELYRELHKVIKAAHEKKEPAVKNMRFRAVLWNPPTFAYAHFWNWLERCWGIACLNDMETFGNFGELFIDTSSHDSMLAGLARSWSNMTMVRHTRGAVENYLPQLWQMTEMFKADLIIVANHIGCRSSMSLSGIMGEEARKRNIPMCTFDYELMDSRVCSRQGIRDQISNFMVNVMKASPLDESLLVIDDDSEW